MNAEVIAIGSELLLGQIQDTNSFYLARVLNQAGIDLFFKTTVGDNQVRIVLALTVALSRAQVVITTGGIGPTRDDITREAVAHVCGVSLEFRPEQWLRIEERFRKLKVPLTENNRRQAFIPKGAVPVPNPVGSAPGFMASYRERYIFSLPGVPQELMAMMEATVLPFLKERYGLAGTIHSRVIRVAGATESRVDELVGDLLSRYGNPTVGILVEDGTIVLRITAKAGTVEEAMQLIGPVEGLIRARLGPLIYGTEADTLEGVIGSLLRDKGYSLSVVETLTGGHILHRLISHGLADIVDGVVLPSRSSVAEFLKIPPAGLTDNAPEVAAALAQAVRQARGRPLGLAVVAGEPHAETAVALGHGDRTLIWEFGTRALKGPGLNITGTRVLDALRRYLMETGA